MRGPRSKIMIQHCFWRVKSKFFICRLSFHYYHLYRSRIIGKRWIDEESFDFIIEQLLKDNPFLGKRESFDLIPVIMPFRNNFESNWYSEVDTHFSHPQINAKFDSLPNQFQPNVFDVKPHIKFNCEKLKIDDQIDCNYIFLGYFFDVGDWVY